MMCRVFVASFCAFVMMSAAQAQAPTVERITISNTGLYRFDVDKIENAPKSARGVFKTVSNPTLIERTERVPGILGASFGVNFEIVGQPTAGLVTIKYITRFPAPGLRDPKTGKVLLTSENDRDHRIGELSFRSYTFDESWEIVKGTWTLEFWHNGKMLAAQKFEVAEPGPQPGFNPKK